MKSEPLIEPKKRKRIINLLFIESIIAYLPDNGCKWKILPPYYGDYNRRMLFVTQEQLLYKLTGKVRTAQGRNAEPSLFMADFRSVKRRVMMPTKMNGRNRLPHRLNKEKSIPATLQNSRLISSLICACRQ
jgi:hypothetical protein